jgi:hypothetical protein
VIAAEVLVPVSAPKCYQTFCQVKLAPHWVPGLRRVKVVRSYPDGRAWEVLFEHGDTLSYSAIYVYDDETRRVSFTPGIGRRDGVSGSVAFASDGDGCRVRAEIDGRPAGEAEAMLMAFTRWMTQ